MKVKQFLFVFMIFVCCFLMEGLLSSVVAMPNDTKVENSKQLPPARNVLTTVQYAPTETEQPFFNKLAGEEKITTDYSIRNKTGTYVGWFGIVRKIDEDKAKGITTLLVEMKYFDGLTDGHIMTVSFYGDGDFNVVANGIGLGLKPLSLVKVYGTVEQQTVSTPELHAEYIRQWDWGSFNFMDYGKDNTNPEWRKLNKITDLEGIYEANPTQKYYEERLGVR